ncbi:hypothetical protein BCR35DRAFT_327462 [Leucosporidium creatinivorum]|uniref:Calpain catalytic domain-containing protein n=1 Tax=Leucosporidium creatinivorum TaxID=106004 RepID=A0A1Y2C1I5_9BASI|nr:hypothetical protein BCR35DRAFT_327462 [Leucosporidium creatinivorum]
MSRLVARVPPVLSTLGLSVVSQNTQACAPKRAPTPAEWSLKLKEAQATGARATKHELAGSFDAAFDSYVKAAQAYIFLLRHCPSQQKKEELRALSTKLVERATRIKQAKKDLIRPLQRERLSIEEQDAVLERSSTVNGVRLPRWTTRDAVDQPFHPTDSQPTLSPLQLQQRACWRPAAEVFPTAQMVASSLRGRDIVQDNVSDCSLVSALIVGAEHHSKFGSKLGLSCLYPQGDDGLPRLSKTRRYTARFLVNGTWRMVTIDDNLPASESGQPMSASTKEQDQLWPALVEKAYLKMMGGYEFHGSNSGIDLHALSGWIPEHIALSSGHHSGKTWTRIFDAFEAGRCVLTLGTGKSEASLTPGLIASHSYAVLDLREGEGRREVELMNPWRTSTSSPTATPSNLSSTWTEDVRNALPRIDSGAETFVVDWDHLSSHFEALHLSWDPRSFRASDSVHCSIPRKAGGTNSGASTQLQLKVEHSPDRLPTEIWVLVSRHLHDKGDAEEFVGLNIVKSWRSSRKGRGATRVHDASSLTDNPFLLYRFDSDPDIDVYNLFVSYRGAAADPRFTLRAFADTPIKLEDGPPPLPYSQSLQGSWTEKTAGGNHACATFLNNPQYRVSLSSLPERPNLRGELSIRCDTSKDTPVNVKLVRRKGERIADFEERDVVAGASTYSYGFDSTHADDLFPESYTLVVSSFQPLHKTDFELRVESNLPLEVSLIPPEGAGMFARSARGSWGSPDGSEQVEPSFLLAVSKPTQLRIRLQAPEGPLPIALSIYSTSTDGAPHELVESTGPFSDAVCGVVTRLFRLPTSDSGYLIILRALPSTVQAEFHLLLYADQPVTLSPQR